MRREREAEVQVSTCLREAGPVKEQREDTCMAHMADTVRKVDSQEMASLRCCVPWRRDNCCAWGQSSHPRRDWDCRPHRVRMDRCRGKSVILTQKGIDVL